MHIIFKYYFLIFSKFLLDFKIFFLDIYENAKNKIKFKNQITGITIAIIQNFLE